MAPYIIGSKDSQMDISARIEFMCRLYEGVYERVILLSPHATLVEAKIKFVVEQLFVLCCRLTGRQS